MATLNKVEFVNDAQVKVVSDRDKKWVRPGDYGFDRAPHFLFVWSRLFQSVISQAGTYLIKGNFHNTHCAIYKSEGGCHIAGVNELVLCKHGCYFDFGREGKQDKELKSLADLITYIVLNWDPMKPIESMMNAAVDFLKKNRDCPDTILSDLEKAIETSSNGGPFGGDALSSFFDWNPFSKTPEDKEYTRYCLVNFDGWTHERVDQKFADKELGESLLARINAEIRRREPQCYRTALCCSPRRDGNKLMFWVNTGSFTQIDGWHTEAELERFISSKHELLKDR